MKALLTRSPTLTIGFRVQGLGVQGLGGLGFTVWGLGFRGSEFRGLGFVLFLASRRPDAKGFSGLGV